jgi:hypothetical protein
MIQRFASLMLASAVQKQLTTRLHSMSSWYDQDRKKEAENLMKIHR